MLTQQTAIEMVKQFANELTESGLHLHNVFLFGSFAKSMQHEHSDIDVAIVADEFTGVGFEDLKWFVKILKKYYLIQPKTYNTKYFSESDPFIVEINKYAIKIN